MPKLLRITWLDAQLRTVGFSLHSSKKKARASIALVQEARLYQREVSIFPAHAVPLLGPENSFIADKVIISKALALTLMVSGTNLATFIERLDDDFGYALSALPRKGKPRRIRFAISSVDKWNAEIHTFKQLPQQEIKATGEATLPLRSGTAPKPSQPTHG